MSSIDELMAYLGASQSIAPSSLGGPQQHEEPGVVNPQPDNPAAGILQGKDLAPALMQGDSQVGSSPNGSSTNPKAQGAEGGLPQGAGDAEEADAKSAIGGIGPDIGSDAGDGVDIGSIGGAMMAAKGGVVPANGPTSTKLALAAANGGVVIAVPPTRPMANGGKVPCYDDGGKIPGKAKVKGDSLKNDHVLIAASPGEIMLPRSVTKAPDAPEKAKQFVAARMADGGPVPDVDAILAAYKNKANANAPAFTTPVDPSDKTALLKKAEGQDVAPMSYAADADKGPSDEDKMKAMALFSGSDMKTDADPGEKARIADAIYHQNNDWKVKENALGNMSVTPDVDPNAPKPAPTAPVASPDVPATLPNGAGTPEEQAAKSAINIRPKARVPVGLPASDDDRALTYKPFESLIPAMQSGQAKKDAEQAQKDQELADLNKLKAAQADDQRWRGLTHAAALADRGVRLAINANPDSGLYEEQLKNGNTRAKNLQDQQDYSQKQSENQLKKAQAAQYQASNDGNSALSKMSQALAVSKFGFKASDVAGVPASMLAEVIKDSNNRDEAMARLEQAKEEARATNAYRWASLKSEEKNRDQERALQEERLALERREKTNGKPIEPAEFTRTVNQIEGLGNVDKLDQSFKNIGPTGYVPGVNLGAAGDWERTKNAYGPSVTAAAMPGMKSEQPGAVEEEMKKLPSAGTTYAHAHQQFAQMKDAIRKNIEDRIAGFEAAGYSPGQVAQLRQHLNTVLSGSGNTVTKNGRQYTYTDGAWHEVQ